MTTPLHATSEGRTDVLTPEPVRCQCGRLAYVFVNVGGRTYCSDCEPLDFGEVLMRAEEERYEVEGE